MREKYKKWVFIFFVGMIIATVCSRIIYQVCVIKVKYAYVEEKELSKTIESVGRIQGKDEIIVVTEPQLLISEIFVTEGQNVKKGDVLYEIDQKDGLELLDSLKDDVEVLKLQSESVASQKQFEQEKYQMDHRHAKETFEAVQSETGQSLQRALDDLENAKEACSDIQEKIENKEEEYKNAEQTGDTERIEQLTSEIEELNLKLEASLEEAEEYEKTYDQMKIEQQGSVRSSRQEVENSSVPIQKDTSVEQNEIQIKAQEEKIKRLTELLDTGKITAPCDGEIGTIYITTGNRTTDSADMVLINKERGMEVTATFMQEGKEKIKEGTSLYLDVDYQNGEKESAVVTSVRLVGEQLKNIEVTADLPNNDFLIGSNIELGYETEKIRYPYVINRSALHLEAEEEYYVYVIREKETLLGDEWEAVRKKVTVLDKNENYAAIEGVGEKDKVIIESSRYLQDQDRIEEMKE